MARPSSFLFTCPLLTFSGVEGKMFEPMALTVIIALVVCVHPVADVCAGR